MDFSIAMNSLGLFRSITDNIKDLPISALNKMLLENDTVCLMVYLIELSPWVRKRKDGFEKFEANGWHKLKESDLVVVSRVEAQVWLALMNLLLEPEARKTYQYSKKNQSVVLRLKDCISEEIVDQIPPIVDLQRYLEELLMMDPPETLKPSFGITPVCLFHILIYRFLIYIQQLPITSRSKIPPNFIVPLF
jgi:hypothetical protein